MILNAGENRQKTALDEEKTFVNIPGMYAITVYSAFYRFVNKPIKITTHLIIYIYIVHV